MVSSKKIVIIDDEPEVAKMLAEMVQLLGFQAVISFGGNRSVNIVADTKPVLILLDLMMPSLSGFDILRSINQDPCLAPIPVIIVSARALSTDIKTGLEAGASAYLTKPIAFLELRTAVEAVVQNC